MKLFLDDIRNPPDESWVIARTYEEAIQHLMTGWVEEVSLDHDLGTERTGYDVAREIERLVRFGVIDPPNWRVHSANPVGRANIERALKAVDEWWNTYGKDQK